MKYKLIPIEPIADTRELVERSCKLYGDHLAFKEFSHDHTLVACSYKALSKDIKALGTSLVHRGLTGEHIGILGDNSIGWIQTYLTVIGGLGVAVPLDKELTDELLEIQILKGDCERLFISERFYERMHALQKKNPQIKTLVILNPLRGRDYGEAWLYHDLLEEGRDLLYHGNEAYLNLPIDHEAMCEILFTSGTTGANKGVMLSQKNLACVINGAAEIINPPKESISLLPIHHSYECSCHMLAGLYMGGTINFNDSLKNVIQNFRNFKPDFTVLVPMFLESFNRHIWKEIEKSRLVPHVEYGLKFSNLIRKVGIDRRRYFFKPILDGFGGNLKQIVSGGAPLSAELMEQFINFGIQVVNGYGITECAPLVSCSSFDWKVKKGSVGMPITGCQVRIDSDGGEGEIQVFGDNVMLGYYKDEEATQATFTEDGWLKTGDLGYLDNEGFLYVTGRIKNLIILSNGENIHAENLEGMLLNGIGYVQETIVYASKEGTMHAACYLDPEWREAHKHEDIQKTLEMDVKEFNKKLPVYMRIAEVLIVSEEFEKTTTKKIKRHAFIGGQ